MYCENCGKQIEDGSKFCRYCGEKIDAAEIMAAAAKKPENAVVAEETAAAAAAGMAQAGKKDIKRKPKRGLIAVLAVALVTALAVFIGISIYNKPENRLARALALGQRYLLEENYEQAIVEFNRAIEIDPKNEEAYIGLAEAYIETDNLEKAVSILEKGAEKTDSEELQELLEKYAEELAEKSRSDIAADSEASEEDCINMDEVYSKTENSNTEADEYGYQYEQSVLGNLIKKIEYINGNYCLQTEYKYDSDNNLETETTYDSSGNIFECKIYDKNGNLIESQAYGGGEVYQCYGYEYDAAGNLVKKELKYGSTEGGPSVLKYEYDEMGNMVKCMRGCDDSNGNFVVWTHEDYEYDTAGKLQREIIYYQGDSDLDIESSERRYAYEYENNGKLVREFYLDASGNITGWNESEYDEMGNEIKKTYYDLKGNIINLMEYTYIYE